MRSQRNNWLTGLSREEFAQLDPWEVVCHPESRPQWIAEVRSKLRVSLTDDEILSILQIGLYKAVASAIEALSRCRASSTCCPYHRRGSQLHTLGRTRGCAC